MILMNYDFANKYLDLELKKEFRDTSSLKKSGFYTMELNKFSAILYKEDNLYFLYGDEEFLITDQVKVLITETSSTENEFCLVNGNEVLVNFLYLPPDPKFKETPFYHLKDEDLDWGLFLMNRINNKEKKSKCILFLKTGIIIDNV